MAMSSDRLSSLLQALQELIKQERAALLAGDPERIVAVAERKLALAETVEKETSAPHLSPAQIMMLSQLARDNHANGVICSAMLRHMTRAIDKLRMSDPHRSYLPDGSERSHAARNTLGAA